MSRHRRDSLPPRVREILRDEAKAHGVPVEHIVGPDRRRTRPACTARWSIIRRLRQLEPEPSTPLIGGWLDIDHTTVLHALSRAEPWPTRNPQPRSAS